MRLTGLEPARRETLDPKSSASTNSATGAFRLQKYIIFVKVPNLFAICYLDGQCFSVKVNARAVDELAKRAVGGQFLWGADGDGGV